MKDLYSIRMKGSKNSIHITELDKEAIFNYFLKDIQVKNLQIPIVMASKNLSYNANKEFMAAITSLFENKKIKATYLETLDLDETDKSILLNEEHQFADYIEEFLISDLFYTIIKNQDYSIILSEEDFNSMIENLFDEVSTSKTSHFSSIELTTLSNQKGLDFLEGLIGDFLFAKLKSIGLFNCFSEPIVLDTEITVNYVGKFIR